MKTLKFNKHKMVTPLSFGEGLGVRLFLLLFLISATSFSQSWQWGKSGGGTQNMSIEETVKQIVTDAQGNVFTLANVGKTNVVVDGHPKVGHGFNGTVDPANMLITSFACDGTYRWSKIIGSNFVGAGMAIALDSQGNLYITGNFGGCYIKYFDTDLTVTGTQVYNGGTSYTYTNCNSAPIIKYSNTGVLQWVKYIDNNVITVSNSSPTYADTPAANFYISVDNADNIHVICSLWPGTYINGLYTNSHPSNTLHTIKFDSNGTFIEGHFIDWVSTGTSPGYNFTQGAFNVSPSTGNIYISCSQQPDPTNLISYSVGGMPVTHTQCLAKFTPQGTFVWKLENLESNGVGTYSHSTMDSDENIYFTSEGQSVNGYPGNPNHAPDSFAGFTYTIDSIGVNNYVGWVNFITKINSQGQGVWSTNSNNYVYKQGKLGINGNEVSMGEYIYDERWKDISLAAPAGTNFTANQGMIRFNKETGTGIAIHSFVDDATDGSYDKVRSIASDHLGNYFIGGNFSNTITVNGTTLTNAGGDTDFYVAKFGTANCNCQVPTCQFKTTNTSQNNTVNFFYQGQNVFTSVAWNFGDGSAIDTSVNPTHHFTTPGTYNVCLTATNSCDSYTYCALVDTTLLGNPEFVMDQEAQLLIAPNPAKTVTNVLFKNNSGSTVLEMYDLQGRIVNRYESTLPKAVWSVDVSEFASGVYIITMKSKDKIISTQRFIKE